jgi:hypothetical protein
VPDGIYALMNPVKSPARKANVNHAAGYPQGKQLPPRHQPILPAGETGHHAVHSIFRPTWSAFATHIVVNALLEEQVDGASARHATQGGGSLREGGALNVAFLQRKEAPARRYRLWL